MAVGRALALLALAVAGLGAARPAAAQQLPPLEQMLSSARTAEDSLAIREAYAAAMGEDAVAAPEAPEEEARPAPAAGLEAAPADTADPGAPAPGAPPPPEPDPTYRSLMEAGDDTGVAGEQRPISYSGQRLRFYPGSEVILLEEDVETAQGGTTMRARGRLLFRNREGVVEAFEGVEIERGASRVGADSLFYDRQSGAVATFGATNLSEGQSETEGADLTYDLETQSGRLGTGVTLSAPWILEGQMDKIGPITYHVEAGHFTTCELEIPHYRFVSKEIKLRRDDVIVAAPITLYFSDIPVFYLPWYVEPVTRGRHSGFLRPAIGINSLLFGSGRERNVQDLGYYYVFGERADARVAADWFTESRFVLRGDARYNVRHEFQGDLRVERVWNRLDDSQSSLVRYRHDHTFSLRSRGQVNVNWSNSRSFLRRNSFDPEEILQRSFRSAGSYSTRFDWGSLVAGADADFRLDQDRTDLRPVDIRVSVNQRPLWGAPGRTAAGAREDQPFWRALQYSASASGRWRLSRAAVDSLGQPLPRIPTDSLGNAIPTDKETIVNEQESDLRFTLNGPIKLVDGAINLTPSASYSARLLNDEEAEDEKFGGTGRINTGLSMNTRFFRIYQAVPGRITRMRHTVAPTVSLNYAPEPTFFGAADQGQEGQDSFTANFSIQQEFDAKVEERDETAKAEGDSLAAARKAAGRPRESSRVLNLLRITNSFPFDILRAREPDKIGFSTLSTRLSSGLTRDFNISTTMTHNLRDEDDEGKESFSFFLSSITTDFSISGGGGGGRVRTTRYVDESFGGRGDEEATEEARERLAEERVQGGVGPWRLSLTHSWSRSRDGVGNRQSLGIGGQILPSPNWSLNYRTTYDITSGEFQGQTLGLVRDLHDWQATLNFSLFPAEPQDRVLILFRVFLRDVPDLEVPYQVRRE